VHVADLRRGYGVFTDVALPPRKRNHTDCQQWKQKEKERTSKKMRFDSEINLLFHIGALVSMLISR
jgi:hypothetical protein